MAARILLSRMTGHCRLNCTKSLKKLCTNSASLQQKFAKETEQLINGAARTRNRLISVKQGHRRPFHTSSRRYINPLFVLFGKQAAKLVSMIGGRQFRKWWGKLPDEYKAKYFGFLQRKRNVLYLSAGFLGTYTIHNYFSHLQVAPVTGRKRYISFTPEQFEVLSKFEYERIWKQVKDSVVTPDHPTYKLITRIVERLVDSNQDIEFFRKQVWTVVVVNSKEANAFVLPNGYIFVYTGLLQVAKNQHQVASVLGHEMSHALLQHGAEKISWVGFLDSLMIIVLAAVWAFVPSDGIAVVTQWFMNRVTEVMLNLPYEREMETEADMVGMKLVAKACYDVRESSNFWQLMTIDSGDLQPPEWISTHPSHQNRVQQLNDQMPEMIQIRDSCHCPPLAKQDPRLAMKLLVEEHIRNKEEKSLKPETKEPLENDDARTA